MDRQDKYERGRAKREEMYGPKAALDVQYLERLAPDLERIVMENLFGDIYYRTELDPRERSLCVISALTALGREPQLRYHIAAALDNGVTKTQIVEVFLQLLFYTGLPAVSTASAWPIRSSRREACSGRAPPAVGVTGSLAAQSAPGVGHLTAQTDRDAAQRRLYSNTFFSRSSSIVSSAIPSTSLST